MSNLSLASFTVDEAQIRESIISSLRRIGLGHFPGNNAAEREAAFEKFLTDTLVPIVFQINCDEEEDPKKVAQALKKLLEKNVSPSYRSQDLDPQRCGQNSVWFSLAIVLACFNQIGFSVFAASMTLYNYSLDRLSKSISRRDPSCGLFKYAFPVLIGLVVGFLTLGYLQDSIKSGLCWWVASDSRELKDNPALDRSAWCQEYRADWLRNQTYATVIGLATIAQAFGFYLLSGNCKFNRWVHHTSDREVSRLLTEFSGATSFQGYLNAAQEEPNGDLRDAKFKMVKEMLKAICENLDSEIFQVVPVVPQNPLSINADDLSVRLVGSGDASQTSFGAEELSRGLLREPNNANANANANARRSALVLNPLTSGSPSLSADGLRTPNYQLSEG
jgi:hypothetical protein